MPLSTIHICLVYDTHIPTYLWEFCTHMFINYVSLQIFVPHTIFHVGLLHIVCFSLFMSLTNGICASVPSSMLFYMCDYMHICDKVELTYIFYSLIFDTHNYIDTQKPYRSINFTLIITWNYIMFQYINLIFHINDNTSLICFSLMSTNRVSPYQFSPCHLDLSFSLIFSPLLTSMARGSYVLLIPHGLFNASIMIW